MEFPEDVSDELDKNGYARIPQLLSPRACQEVVASWSDATAFRKSIVMENHGYGEGEYRYFAYPLPPYVESLRKHAYAALLPAANLHQERLGLDFRFPQSLDEYLALCHESDQTRPTPLVLRYATGGFNRLHQDRYGDLAFPLQLVVMLSCRLGGGRQSENESPAEFEGGEFLLTEGRARMQSKGTALHLDQGEGLVFFNQTRAVEGKRGYACAAVRHGVSEVRRGIRMTLGVIFHDAR